MVKVMGRSVRLLKIAIPESVNVFFDPEGLLVRRLERLVINTLYGGKEILTIVGGYGMGKTHTMKYIEHLSRLKNLKTIYIQSPGRTFIDFYSTVVENLLDSIAHLKHQVGDPALRRALELLDDEETSIYARGWLLGYTIPPRIRYKLGLMGNIRETQAIDFLVEILTHTAITTRGLIIFLDEMEVLLNQPKNARFSYTESLRELIDRMPMGVTLITAMTPACWDDITKLNPALFRRLSGNILYLKPLRREHVKAFLSLYFKELLGILDDDIYDYIYDLSNGVQGEILRLTSIVLEEALYRSGGGSKKLGLNDVKQILSEYI
jgi:hypothetical protein